MVLAPLFSYPYPPLQIWVASLSADPAAAPGSHLRIVGGFAGGTKDCFHFFRDGFVLFSCLLKISLRHLDSIKDSDWLSFLGSDERKSLHLVK